MDWRVGQSNLTPFVTRIDNFICHPEGHVNFVLLTFRLYLPGMRSCDVAIEDVEFCIVDQMILSHSCREEDIIKGRLIGLFLRISRSFVMVLRLLIPACPQCMGDRIWTSWASLLIAAETFLGAICRLWLAWPQSKAVGLFSCEIRVVGLGASG